MSFKPTGFSETIFKDRYAFTESETWDEACKRVAKQMAIAETSDKFEKYNKKFYDVLVSNEFVPGGRIWYNAGRPNPQLLNCFVLTKDLDSKEGWANLLRENVITSMTGGGCGQDYSDIRPNGSEIKGHRGVCPGPVALMKGVNAAAQMVRAGGGRRAANMFSLDLDHPDVVQFLDSKLKMGELDMANISVRCKETSKFIEAVINDSDWELSWKGQYKKTIKARPLWNKIVKNAYNSAEPGFLNMELGLSDSTIYYIEDLVTTNPCIVGSTLIATADGRNAVTIEQLAREDNDIPVYSVDPQTGQTQIKMGRNPRKTKSKTEVWKLVLDDGSEFIATPDHHIMLKDGSYKELRHLKNGESLMPFNSFENNKYRQISNVGAKLRGWGFRNRRQYRLIAEFFHGKIDGKTTAIHHRDFNSLNDNIDNLELMTHDAHVRLHADKMVGKNNPYYAQTSEWKRRFASKPGKKNGKYCGISNEKLVEIGKEFLARTGDLKRSEWFAYSKENGLPQSFSSFRFGGSFSKFKSLVVANHKVKSVEFYGYEDVYNITVDDNHNYQIITSFGDDKFVESSGICAKNCGEILLTPYGNCCLGHIVLPRFVRNGEIDKERLATVIRTGVRFLDNVLDVNSYPLPEMKAKAAKLRRIGLGTTGLADMLAMLGIKYGSEEGNKFIDDLFRFISKIAYEASVFLAVEKGAFPECKPDLHIKSGYMRRMTKKIKALVEEHGIRNCALLTQAPTGTVSIVSGNCSSGIEPMFAFAYWRNYFDQQERKRELCFHPLFIEFMNDGKSVEHFVASHDLTVRDHMEVQKIIQRHIDNAVSKTINIPKNYPIKKVGKLWLDYLPFLKGTTFFREGSRVMVDENGVEQEPPLVPIPLKEAIRLYKEQNHDKVESIHVDDCPGGVCELEENS